MRERAAMRGPAAAAIVAGQSTLARSQDGGERGEECVRQTVWRQAARTKDETLINPSWAALLHTHRHTYTHTHTGRCRTEGHPWICLCLRVLLGALCWVCFSIAKAMHYCPPPSFFSLPLCLAALLIELAWQVQRNKRSPPIYLIAIKNSK